MGLVIHNTNNVNKYICSHNIKNIVTHDKEEQRRNTLQSYQQDKSLADTKHVFKQSTHDSIWKVALGNTHLKVTYINYMKLTTMTL